MVRPLMTDTVFLAQKALPADAGDIAVADDLLDTLKAHEDGCTPCEMFNPVIVYRKGLYLAEEGCLSLQGQRRARRHRTIKVQWQDRQMQTHVRNFTGWTAQIIQHEIDHCSGILI